MWVPLGSDSFDHRSVGTINNSRPKMVVIAFFAFQFEFFFALCAEKVSNGIVVSKSENCWMTANWTEHVPFHPILRNTSSDLCFAFVPEGQTAIKGQIHHSIECAKRSARTYREDPME